jgi:hypothetical protein
MSPSIKRPFWIVNAVSSHQVHAEFDRVLDWPHDAFPAELYRPQTTHKGDEAMGLVQMMDRPQQVDPLLTAEDVAARLNVSKDWVWDHSSRKLPYLPVIRMSDGTLR